MHRPHAPGPRRATCGSSRAASIPDEDVPRLREMGVAEVLLQDTPPETIVTRIRDLVAARPAG